MRKNGVKTKKVNMDSANSWTIEDVSGKKQNKAAIWFYNTAMPKDATKAMIGVFTEEELFDMYLTLDSMISGWHGES